MLWPVLLALLALVVLAVVLPGRSAAATPAAPAHHGRLLPDHIDLPDGFQPEGIAVAGPFAYLGSLVDGDVYRANLLTGAGRVISQGPGTPSLGMKVDRFGRLWVSGGSGGDARVVDTRTGRVLASWALSDQPSFVNDVVLTRHAAWFTDSLRARLYRVPLGPAGRLPATAQSVPLGGDWVQPDGGALGANGITTTPDGRALLVVSTTPGELYRVDPRTGAASRVDLGGASLVNGDGLLRHGRTLYAVQNVQNVITELRLNRAGTRAAVVGSLTSPDLDVPTTVARFAGALYLPNARFTTPPEPTTPYWVTQVPLH
jgi:sugar lactone lactonase YvrE